MRRLMELPGMRMGDAYRLAPVSYTHLDVYKRQKQECGRRVEASAEADGIYAEAGAGSTLRRRGRRR